MTGSKVREALHKFVYCDEESLTKLGEFVVSQFSGKAELKSVDGKTCSIHIKIKGAKQACMSINYYCQIDLGFREFLKSEDCRACIEDDDEELFKDYNELLSFENYSTMYNATVVGNMLNIYP